MVESCSLPTSAKNLQEEDIKSYNSDNSTQRMLLDALQPPEDFKYVVQNSQCCYAIYHSDFQGLSSPTGYCHVQKRDRQFSCTNRSCLKKRGNSKQMKLWTICLFYILFCVLKMSCVSGPVNTAPLSPSGESNKDIFIFSLFWTLVWTSLPEAIESSTSLESFKSKQWLHSYSYLILYHYYILFYQARRVGGFEGFERTP